MGIIDRKAQEEMVGFGLIIVIVAVILLVFLWFFLAKPSGQNIESYEAQGFVNALLQYTTECYSYYGALDIQKLIRYCDEGEECKDGRDSCMILESTIKNITQESWKAGNTSSVKGYELDISVRESSLMNITEGNKTSNSRGYIESIPNRIKVYFSVYS